MIRSFKALVAGLALLAAAPFSAGAVTVTDAGVVFSGMNDNGDLGSFAAGGGADTLAIKFTAGETLLFGAGVTGVGTIPPTMPNDLETITFGISLIGPMDMTVSDTLGNFMFSLQAVTGNGVTTPIEIASGDMFWLVVNSTGPINDVDVDFTWSTVAVPLPAAGWMFLSGLAGIAVLARRRS